MDKSPLLAALISIPFPGIGHLYCGAVGRGLALMAGLYAATMALSALSPYALLLYPVMIGLIAYDAWRAAGIENDRERADLAAGRTPPRALVWSWAACRAAWIFVLPGLYGAAMAVAAAYALRHGPALAALLDAAMAAGALYLGWRAARYTADVVRGTRALSARAMTSEISAAVFLCGVCVVLILIAAPAYRGLFRKSAEGAMKGNLAALREGVRAYRSEHGGRPPESLQALVADGTLREIPRLWPRSIGVPHAATAETTVVAGAAGGDSGKWAYVVSASSPDATGTVFIDCTHTDTRASAWSSY